MRFEDKIQDMVEARDDQTVDELYKDEHALMEALYANEDLVRTAEEHMSANGGYCKEMSDAMDEIILELAPQYGYDVSIFGDVI